ncbi:MAG: hypothetical protein AB7I42_17805 [Bradyrhizobium sp.]|nr:hypothetical protein [Bradyrhizobium sp.]
MIAALFVAGAAAVSSIAEIRAGQPHLQLTQATQPAPTATPQDKKDVPAESKPGGTRPTTPAPEPARPDIDAQKAGAEPALPPAPAEKIGPPIDKK